MQDNREFTIAYDSRTEQVSFRGGPCLVAWARLLIWAMRNADTSARLGLREGAPSTASDMSKLAPSGRSAI